MGNFYTLEVKRNSHLTKDKLIKNKKKIIFYFKKNIINFSLKIT